MSSANPITKRYYPQLSEVITVDDLPDFLDFAKEGLDSLLGKIHYKNFQFSKSARGDAAFYSLDIVSKNIGLDLPFGLRFVLNPDVDGDTTISSFPITLQYQWEVLAFLRSFDLSGFAFTPDAFYQLGLKIFKVTDVQVLANTLNFFVNPSDTSVSKYQQIVDDINSLYPSANLSLPAGQTPTVNLLATLISENVNIPESISEVMFATYILDSNLATTESKLQQFFNIIVPGGIQDYIQKLIKPKAKASITLSAGIEFPTTILQPVTQAGVIIPDTKSIFQFAEATFYVDTEAGIGSQLELGGSLIPTYAQIGNTGLIISFTNAKLDLSTTTNIPEADAAGYPVDFVGLYVQQASVSFTKFGEDDTENESASIMANNLLIGTGGISGTIKIKDGGLLHRKFGSFSAELDAFSITFRQNAILNCAISGKVTLSKFMADGQPATILIDAMIKDNGDFSITAKAQNFLPKITWPDVFELTLRSLKLGEQDGHFYLEVAGTLSFIADVPVLGDILPKNIEITKLVIWDNGHLEFSGGVLPLPLSFSLSVGPVKLEVDHMSIAPYKRSHDGVDREYLCIGFDGMINTGRAGVNAAGNGIKYYFSVDDEPFDQFISIDGIAIDLTVPGNVPEDQATFILHGFLNVHQPTAADSIAATEYTGAVSLTMPKLHLAASAGMRLAPDVPAFVVDIGIDLPTPIPIFAGLGIYGFRGLVGQHYIPSKTAAGIAETATWWDYYKAPGPLTKQQGVQIDKFGDEPGFSIGAGASIATSLDSGLIFSAKLFLLLGLPSVFLIQGQAGILSTRLGLNDKRDPPFSALIAIGDQSFIGNLSVDYKIPESGAIFNIHGELDIAFFFNNVSGWYINLGKDQPASARIRASILSLFQGYAYLMLSAQGVKGGAGASFNFSLGNSVIKAGFTAYIDLAGHLSFRPVQIGGSIEMGGSVFVKILIIKLGLSLRVGLSVEAPKPVNIIGFLEVSVKIFFKKISAKLEIRLGPSDNDVSVLLQGVPVLQIPDPVSGYLPAAATNILSGETFPVNFVKLDNVDTIPAPGDPAWMYDFTVLTDADGVTIPLDSYLDIELLKPVKPNDFLGGAGNQLPDGYQELLPPQKGVSAQVKHEYALIALDIFAWKGDFSTGEWVSYQIYEAVTAITDANEGGDSIDLSTLKPGYWQFIDKNKYNKIRLLSQDMFSYLGDTKSNLPDMDAANFAPQDLFCYDSIVKTTIIDWKTEDTGTDYQPDVPTYYDSLTLTFSGITGSVAPESGFNANALMLQGSHGTLTIALSEPLAHIELDFGQNGHQIQVNFLSTVYRPGYFNTITPTLSSKQVSNIGAGQTNSSAVYDDPTLAQTIDQIVVTFDGRNPADYVGDLVIGGHYALPAQFTNPWLTPKNRGLELERSLLNVTLYNRNLSAEDVIGDTEAAPEAIVARWPMDSLTDTTGVYTGAITGSPDQVSGFYNMTDSSELELHNIYSFSAESDSVIIPFAPELKVEDASFAFESTVLFDPFTTGICTLWYKVAPDSDTTLKRGFALHLSQQAPADIVYTTAESIPQYSIWFTCYQGADSRGTEVQDRYTLHCNTGKISKKQYKQIAVSVNRELGTVDIYVDRILKASVDIPAELSLYNSQVTTTYLEQISYLTTSLQARAADNDASEAKVISESQILSDTLNKTIQPIWRPDTIFAVKVGTQDSVTYNGHTNITKNTHAFGFKTVGPIGYFQQHNKTYQQLVQEDRAGEFKLADLKSYIDYTRSFPDAQGRYNLSKPVFYHDPQIRLFFTESYMNAMFSNWDNYQGLNPVNSKLEVDLIDPSGVVTTQQLVWEPEKEIPITLDNYKSLSSSQQLVFLFNQAAGEGTCNPMPVPVVKKLRQASYQFPDVTPGKLYTALFTSVYQPDGEDEQRVEVHKFSFKTSQYASFQDQAGSMVLDATPGAERYAISQLNVAFTQQDIDDRLKKLIDDDAENDPADTVNYAVKFDRVLYGGLKLLNLEPVARTTVYLIVNTDPGDQSKKLIGILISGTEPFNDPKLTDDILAGTLGLTLTEADGTVLTPDTFIYIQSGDTSSAFITNTDMDISSGSAVFYFQEKIFNGIDYTTDTEEYTTDPAIDLSQYFNS